MNLESSLAIAKTMKRPIIHVNENYILGSDDEFTMLSIIRNPPPYEIPRPYSTRLSGEGALLTKDKVETFSSTNTMEFYTEYDSIGDGGDYINIFNENYIYNTLMNLLRKTSNLGPLIYSEEGLEKTGFMQIAKMKIDDGSKNYIFGDKYLSVIFSKLHAINQKDKVAVEIYVPDNQSYIMRFLINKKTYIIEEFMRFRQMI